MTKVDKVLNYLVDHPAGASAVTINGIARTGDARKIISVIRAKGFDIRDEWCEFTDENGDTCRYKRYFLHG